MKIIGPHEPKNPNAINTTSRSVNWSKFLSPFFLGPVHLYNGHTSKTVENAWQYAKLYPQYATREGKPTADYWRWAKKGWGSSFAHRYPMGKGKIPLGSLWNGRLLDYVAARKQIYIPLYMQAVKRTEAFQILRRKFKSNPDLVLWDFDGYDHHQLDYTYENVIEDETRKMGHAFVLAMMLESPETLRKINV